MTITAQIIKGQCSYYSDRISSTQFFDVQHLHPELIQLLLENGFRHFGTRFFRPDCGECRDCIPYRVFIPGFNFNTWQRRILNKSISVSLDKPDDQEAFSLYLLHKRKFNGSLHESFDEFSESFLHPYDGQGFISFRNSDGALAGVCHFDDMQDSLSAIYTYYDYEKYARFSLGSLAILTLIQMAQTAGKRYVYLGYLIEGHSHMGYKSRYFPSEKLSADNSWIPYEKNDIIRS